ncbi:Aste57867_7224 [Aphanomyces stellatus]|uniref:Aste57867_7213 protein n=1 Tax=Aphanomyces stellatus TaxID=120398 RepID=A0A485KGI1_9STRA|nr:hypothetical protein As57867_007199 [Aphanomyces stellatus]KAF0704902.1 hypothetical protein As57867_007188 [Aphanomyces stellatus]VFT84139.1 Aste57867_7213 [Aphanomyces stellatus]VFT84150.1 Aste57867_7224 [Aphanomyces stellatus]
MSLVQKLAQALERVLKYGDEDRIKEVIDKLLSSPSDLIKPTQRIAELENAAGVISMDHHITATTAFFDNFHKFEKRPCAVVFGYKQQGKSQFLYFLAKLLIELGEGVVYLDQSIAPERGKAVAEVDPKISPNCCLAVWKSNLETYLLKNADVSSDSYSVDLRTTALVGLQKFSLDGKPESFSDFCFLFEKLCKFRNLRVWMIVDEATSDELQAFPITWPEEQKLTPFHFVLSGSLGMAQFVAKQHLRKAVWDLPLFDLGETAKLAKDLQAALGIPNQMLEDALGFNMVEDEQVNLANLGDVLHGLFGGVPGYTAELFLALYLGLSLDMFLAQLYERIVDAFTKTLGNNRQKDQMAKNWLISMDDPIDPWNELRNAGLCGWSPPRGVILAFVLKFLSRIMPVSDGLSMVRTMRQTFTNDAGLDGCLLELQTILELKQGAYIPKCVSVLSFEAGVWNATEESLECIPKKLVPSVWLYQPGFPIKAVRDQIESKWHCVEVPTGFCVLDVLLARIHENELHFFLVQITRSASPFARHATNMTCSDACKSRIAALLGAARKAIDPEADLTCKETFVMLAPNCIDGHHIPPPAHTNPYYFVSTFYPTSLSVVKRRNLDQNCCNCTKGRCTVCVCSTEGQKCHNCASAKCSRKA